MKFNLENLGWVAVAGILGYFVWELLDAQQRQAQAQAVLAGQQVNA
jgi:hypothetical protein